jgi:hypothetical protein
MIRNTILGLTAAAALTVAALSPASAGYYGGYGYKSYHYTPSYSYGYKSYGYGYKSYGYGYRSYGY